MLFYTCKIPTRTFVAWKLLIVLTVLLTVLVLTSMPQAIYIGIAPALLLPAFDKWRVSNTIKNIFYIHWLELSFHTLHSEKSTNRTKGKINWNWWTFIFYTLTNIIILKFPKYRASKNILWFHHLSSLQYSVIFFLVEYLGILLEVAIILVF